MQKEENYAAANPDAEGIFAANADNSSSPANNNDNNNPTYYHHDSRSLSSYHDSEVYNNHTSTMSGTSVMVDYMLNTPPDAVSTRTSTYQEQQKLVAQQSNNMSNMNCVNNVVDRTLSFADVMQFADFGPKLALNHPQHFQQHQQNENTNTADHIHNRDHANITGIIEDDPVYFLKFPVLSNSHMMLGHRNTSTIIHDDDDNSITDRDGGFGDRAEEIKERDYQEEDAAAGYNNPVQLEFLGNAYVGNAHEENIMSLGPSEKIETINTEGAAAGAGAVGNNKSSSSSSKRKRPRTIKTNEEVESQRMTHIAVERNRRKQMNEHLRVLRSLMPSSYVQRGDQASIIGGAIEFVRELEQLLQCLESQKRRRLYGDQVQGRPIGDPTSNSSSSTVLGLVQQPPQPQPQMGFPPPIIANNQFSHQDNEQHQLDSTAITPAAGGMLQEETAESKSCVADVEVKVLGFDALIKILSRRRAGQLIKVIAALEDLQFTILHTNITAIEQTVLYSFNVKVASEARFTAEDIAGSVQQIFTFIHANTNII